jgi:hypothetical protein
VWRPLEERRKIKGKRWSQERLLIKSTCVLYDWKTSSFNRMYGGKEKETSNKWIDISISTPLLTFREEFKIEDFNRLVSMTNNLFYVIVIVIICYLHQIEAPGFHFLWKRFFLKLRKIKLSKTLSKNEFFLIMIIF